ncbi:MAG TPA: GNAT family N-acetyltransferase [Solirubrobacteraceae bacterium]|jgi:GAF domain-containing protein/GNAT superfamily N-acetyltransferase|nr:GNAT family N-acetyltransferase [Solirubrobacteraceae bacterium]
MTPTGEAGIEPRIEHAASSETWLRHTLEEILSQVRVLLDVDGCAFQTIDLERRHIIPAASWFETSELRTAMEPVLDRPYDPARGGVTEAAVERGDSVLITDMESWKGAGALRMRLRHQLDPEAARMAWEWYRTSTFISCPVRTAGGRTLGVLALSASPPRPPLSEEQLRVTEVFASLAALALERSELLEREADRARTEELLHGAAQEMTASLDLDAVYQAIVDQATLISGAAAATLLRLDVMTQTLRGVAATGGAGGASARRVPVAEGIVGHVARTGEPYVGAPTDGESAELGDGDGGGSCVHVPVGLGPRRFGVLSVMHPDPGALGARELALLESLTRPAAAAIANALEFQHERRIAGALTRGFIPDAPPELDGFELGLVYEPVGHEVSGGDIFGVWRLPAGALALLVGDVSGKGLEVAAVSAMVRFFIEARTWDSSSPSTVLEQTNSILRSRLPGGVALVTAFLAIVDGELLRYANAGHIPPIVVGPHRPPIELPTTGLPLGVHDDASFTQRELRFGPGELLFACTDGLHEARRGGEQFGQDRVAQLVAEHAATRTPQELVALAYARVVAWTPQLGDDVAIIALRPAASGEQPEIRDDPPDGPASRALFAEYMRFVHERIGLPAETVIPAHVFASEDDFGGDGAAWLVAFDATGAPLGCGGLRVLQPGVGEIKRMFVSARARGTGLGRRLLRELERRAAQAGMSRVRLLTTELLRESRALYAAEGYHEIERLHPPDIPVEIWLEKPLHS